MIFWDFSWTKPSLAQIQAAGVAGVVVYVHNDGRGFASNADGFRYCQTLRDAGIIVEGVHEAAAGNLTTNPGLGAGHGRDARSVARAWGFPDFQAIHSATDVNLSSSQYGARNDYTRNFASTCGPTLIYDEAGAIDFCVQAGTITHGWQTGAMSFSDYRVSPNAWMLQLTGVNTDRPFGLGAGAVDDNKLLIPYPFSEGNPDMDGPALKKALHELLVTDTDDQALDVRYALAGDTAGLIYGENLDGRKSPSRTLPDLFSDQDARTAAFMKALVETLPQGEGGAVIDVDALAAKVLDVAAQRLAS